MANISFYGSHNTTYVIEEDGEILVVLEIERLFNAKNIGIAQYKTVRGENILFYSKYLIKWMMEKYNISEFENCYHRQGVRLITGYPSKELHLLSTPRITCCWFILPIPIQRSINIFF